MVAPSYPIWGKTGPVVLASSLSGRSGGATMASGRFVLALGVSALFLAATGQGKAACADLALVLAIDASGSIDTREYVTQMQGYARALQSDEVARAIDEAGHVEAMAVVWGDADFPVQQTGWVRLDIATERTRFSAELTRMKREATGNTGLARALETGLDLLQARPDCDGRRIINVSGDGRNSFAPRMRGGGSLENAKMRAKVTGVTVNALAIENEEPALAHYFADEVIVGRGAFVMSAAGFDAFADSIREKLYREIRLPQMALAR